MSEMVERVAAALRQAVESSEHNFGAGSIKSLYGEAARAAIAAMREPTEAMQDAGAYPRENRKPVADIWRAMIDSELGERD